MQAEIGADLAAKGYASGHITTKVDATGLPATPHATITAEGTLLNAPLSLSLTADESNGAFKVNIAEAAWKSLKAGRRRQPHPAGGAAPWAASTSISAASRTWSHSSDAPGRRPGQHQTRSRTTKQRD